MRVAGSRVAHRGAAGVAGLCRDWVEKTTTDLARRFDTIRVEDLHVRAMTRSARGTRACPGVNVAQKRGLNREIHRQGWGLLVAG